LWEQAAGNGWDRKSIVFFLIRLKVSILRAGACGSRRLGAAGIEKVSFFLFKFLFRFKVSVLRAGVCASKRLGATGMGKVQFFLHFLYFFIFS